MSDLCKDTRTGKRSKRETELRAHELAEAERKKVQQEGGQKDETATKQTLNESVLKEDQPGSTPNKSSQAGPVMRIVNGEIVLDTASLQVDRHADAERNGDDLEDVVENSLTRKVNQATYGKRSKTESWDEGMTELFYRGLRMFGTDFMLISKMFPGRSRRQIKLKFNNEERRDPQRIRETLLGPRESIDINTYSEMTNTVYDDPRLIQQELDEEKKRIEEQYEKDKKAQEDLLRNPDGVAGNNALGVDKAGIKSKRNNKKQSARDLGGGTEEILGSIDD
jgi:transcription factor TFIIIB component B''